MFHGKYTPGSRKCETGIGYVLLYFVPMIDVVHFSFRDACETLKVPPAIELYDWQLRSELHILHDNETPWLCRAVS